MTTTPHDDDLPRFLRRSEIESAVPARDLEEEPVAHRSGNTDVSGKKNVRKEVLVTEQMAADILAVATIKKMGEGEYMRRCVERDLYGELELMRRSIREHTE